MTLTINDICIFTNSTPPCRNFVEGERVLNEDHVILCGRTSVSNDYVNFIAFSLQTSHLKSNTHEITGSISATGKIINAKCSCKAGLSEKCKHSVAVFLHLNRIYINNLQLVSCRDTKCLWKMPHAKSLEKYAPNPLFEHECLKEKFKKGYPTLISEEQRQEINKILITGIKDSALFKHMYE